MIGIKRKKEKNETIKIYTIIADINIIFNSSYVCCSKIASEIKGNIVGSNYFAKRSILIMV